MTPAAGDDNVDNENDGFRKISHHDNSDDFRHNDHSQSIKDDATFTETLDERNGILLNAGNVSSTNNTNAANNPDEPSPAKPATTSKPNKQQKTPPSIAEKVIDGLTHGQTPRMIATDLNLPLDFVDLIIEQERTAGRLNIYDLRSCNTTTGEGCDPDPESLVCAGCPILPKAIRQRQSVFGRLKAKLHR